MALTEDQMCTKAVEIVTRAHSDGSDFRVATTVNDFFDGHLFVVFFKLPNNGGRENYVYFAEDRPTLYLRADELARYFAGKRPVPTLQRMTRDVLTIGGIAGIIALMITAALCYAFIHDPKTQVPEYFAHTLTAIIGFYFGNQVKK